MTGNPERLGPKPEIFQEFSENFSQLIRWGILEGLIDPNIGTVFQLFQYNVEDFTAYTDKGPQFDAPRTLVIGASVPNPLVYDFEELVLDEKTLEDKHRKALKWLEDLADRLRDDEVGED